MNITDNLTLKQALISGLGFWHKSQSFLHADTGSTDNCVDAVTRVINHATDSYTSRTTAFHSTRQIFTIINCTE